MALTLKSTSYGIHVTGDTSGAISTDKLQIQSVIFTPVAGANDAFTLSDAAGNVLCKGVGAVQNDSFQIDFYGAKVDGLTLTAMTDATDVMVILLV